MSQFFEDFKAEAEADAKNESDVLPGQKFILDGKTYTYAGTVDDPSNLKEHGKPAGQLEGEDLFRVFDQEELEKGVRDYKTDQLIESMDGEMQELMKNYWQAECVNNKENNPDNVAAPI